MNTNCLTLALSLVTFFTTSAKYGNPSSPLAINPMTHFIPFRISLFDLELSSEEISCGRGAFVESIRRADADIAASIDKSFADSIIEVIFDNESFI